MEWGESMKMALKSFIPEHILEEVRSRADIVEVVSDYVPLKAAGNNFKGLCPFHQEKTPSFTANREKQIYHCFGCGAGGNVFRFLMQMEDLPFIESVRRLASRFQVTIPETSKSSGNAEAWNKNEIWKANTRQEKIMSDKPEPTKEPLGKITEICDTCDDYSELPSASTPGGAEWVCNNQDSPEYGREKLLQDTCDHWSLSSVFDGFFKNE